jgi:hypothetical protein
VPTACETFPVHVPAGPGVREPRAHRGPIKTKNCPGALRGRASTRRAPSNDDVFILQALLMEVVGHGNSRATAACLRGAEIQKRLGHTAHRCSAGAPSGCAPSSARRGVASAMGSRGRLRPTPARPSTRAPAWCVLAFWLKNVHVTDPRMLASNQILWGWRREGAAVR